MKTSTTAIMASVAVLVAVGVFYSSSSLNPQTNDSVQLAFASGTTAAVDPTAATGHTGFYVFDSGKEFISKNKFIGMGHIGTAPQTEEVSPFDGVLSTLAVHIDKAPGSGKSWTFTVYVEDVATDLECEISGTSTSCLDEHGGDDIAIDALNTINVKVSDSTGKAIKKTTASATVAFEP